MQNQFTSNRRVKGCVGSTPLKTRSQRNDQCRAKKWCNRRDRQDSLLHCVNRIGRKFLTSRLITSSVRTSHCLPCRFIIIFRSFNKTLLYGHQFSNHFGYNTIFFYNCVPRDKIIYHGSLCVCVHFLRTRVCVCYGRRFSECVFSDWIDENS